MSAELPSQLLTAQHRRIDEGVQGIIDGSGERAVFAEALVLLRLHLYVEEECLFPPLAKSGLTMPLFVMKNEHGQMWPFLQSLSEACASSSPLEGMCDSARELFQLLQIHNQKEEQIVYTAADRLVTERDGKSLTGALKAGKAPDDWVCEKAPR